MQKQPDFKENLPPPQKKINKVAISRKNRINYGINGVEATGN